MGSCLPRKDLSCNVVVSMRLENFTATSVLTTLHQTGIIHFTATSVLTILHQTGIIHCGCCRILPTLKRFIMQRGGFHAPWKFHGYKISSIFSHIQSISLIYIKGDEEKEMVSSVSRPPISSSQQKEVISTEPFLKSPIARYQGAASLVRKTLMILFH